MKEMCTQQALRITSCIHEADTKGNIKNKDGTKILEQRIDHAGRLLLNRGYLSDAIKTENSTYLNDEIVKKVISQMWYKHESVSFGSGLLFFILTMFHSLLLLPLMVTMENKPLGWLYRQYSVPVMKVLLNGFGWLMNLVAFAYMLLFDFTEIISRTDWFIIAWMTSYFIDETKQIIIAIMRGKIGSYLSNWWNRLDWLTMTVYLSGMLTKLGSGQAYHNASKILLVLTFILMCVRFLNSLTISEIVGPKLVMVRKMFLDTFAFLAIMTVIIMCYNVSYYAILYSENSDLSFAQLERVFRNGFWILFGELSLESDRLKEPDCTFNKTIYNAGKIDRCPSELGLFLAPYLKAAYTLLAIVLLLNLLIAMYSNTFSEVHEKSKFYWALLQTDFLEEYSVKSIFPIHFQLLVVPMCLVHFLFWIPISWLRSNHQSNVNKNPMYFRVFIYDANFDLKLDETLDAEGKAALEASGDLEGTDEDKLTVLQTEVENHKRVTNKIEERTNKIDERTNKMDERTNKIDERSSEILNEIEQMKRDIRLLCKAVSPDTMIEEEVKNPPTEIRDADKDQIPQPSMVSDDMKVIYV
ncbi:transient receptor potential cation channel subfamily M member-like 2 isoform X2 [Ostrea edulis]|uniref:transient receptor potential cation channel subfamily M member-like 2 isoform X2 n=1 Tax=Ostrea edulis TaxID=37623 RepID=UPI0024AFDEAB|nr:transient receptor potential cation channel subfamily M member-like 2 isoform X2 [Ostrea edulis]